MAKRHVIVTNIEGRLDAFDDEKLGKDMIGCCYHGLDNSNCQVSDVV